MSEQVLVQFRADKLLKQEAAEIYESLGMDLAYGVQNVYEKKRIGERTSL